VSADDGLGPLAARVPDVLRGSAAYHVPQAPNVRAKLGAGVMGTVFTCATRDVQVPEPPGPCTGEFNSCEDTP
jgi:hypothetical protein